MTADDTVQCWGLNASGQVGDGTTDTRTTPVAVAGLTGVAQVSAGYSASCAVLGDATVACWGDRDVARTGTHALTPVVVAGITDAVEVVVGSDRACARTTSGVVSCWDAATAPTAVAGLSSAATALTAGASHTCALLDDATVECWGDNTDGQLGDGTTADAPTPVAVVGLTDAVDVDTGAQHTCSVRSGGSVVCWGSNSNGRLGDGTTTPSSVPVAAVDVTGAVEVDAGTNSTCVRLTDATVECWGSVVGSWDHAGSTYPLAEPAPGLSGVLDLSVGQSQVCAVLTDTSVDCLGAGSPSLGNGTSELIAPRPRAVGRPAPFSDTAQLVSGSPFLCARSDTGTVRCWGDNTFGQLGEDTTGLAPAPGGGTADRSVPVAVEDLTDVVDVDNGGYTACAALGDGKATCWGNNGNGTLGDGTTISRWQVGNVLVSTDPDIALTGVDDVEVGGNFACALRAGSVSCWGVSGAGQTGDFETNRTVDEPVPGLTGVAALDTGNATACAVLTDDSVRCWGENGLGQVGDGTTDDRATPAPVSGLGPAAEARVGTAFACARLLTGTVWCWGANGGGMLGNCTNTASLTPVQVSGIADATRIATGNSHACAILADTTVRCWGNNSSGQLGDGTRTSRNTPVTVTGLSGAVDLAAGNAHTCATTEGAEGILEVWCWGNNGARQLGDGTADERTTPVEVLDVP